MKVTVTLKAMKFFAFHGVSEQERTIGGHYTVDMSYSVETEATETDNLGDTVNYSEVYEVVKSEMKRSSQLLEHVAARILKSVQGRFPRLTDVDVRVSKIHPPLSGEVYSVELRV